MALLGANLLVLNLWLAPLAGLRWDATAQQEYTLSQTTKELIGSLQEPLLIRAYISSKSHPLLDPLRPQVEDLLREYAIAGKGRVTAEVMDPAQDPALEAEANQTYGIQPTPFQVSDRYQASVINAYFDILVRYGDQDVVLNFRDLIQVEQSPEGGVDVRLSNPEYDLTSAIKKVLYGFQSIDTVLASQTQPLKLTLYATPHTLPPELAGAPDTIRKVADDLAQKSGGKLVFEEIDPTMPRQRRKRRPGHAAGAGAAVWDPADPGEPVWERQLLSAHGAAARCGYRRRAGSTVLRRSSIRKTT